MTLIMILVFGVFALTVLVACVLGVCCAKIVSEVYDLCHDEKHEHKKSKKGE